MLMVSSPRRCSCEWTISSRLDDLRKAAVVDSRLCRTWVVRWMGRCLKDLRFLVLSTHAMYSQGQKGEYSWVINAFRCMHSLIEHLACGPTCPSESIQLLCGTWQHVDMPNDDLRRNNVRASSLHTHMNRKGAHPRTVKLDMWSCTELYPEVRIISRRRDRIDTVPSEPRLWLVDRDDHVAVFVEFMSNNAVVESGVESGVRPRSRLCLCLGKSVRCRPPRVRRPPSA